jgi:ubiquinone/menaquinone biosynthesis C-methylase UbiE
MSIDNDKSKRVIEIKQYWEHQAELAREAAEKLVVIDPSRNVFVDRAGGGTMKDWRIRELEIQALANYISENDRVLDVGCGNGFATIQLAIRKGCNITGLDYSQGMIDNAHAFLKNNYADLEDKVQFVVGDVTQLAASIDRKFDVILTERCLINLADWNSQKDGIESIAENLQSSGLFLMLEGSKQGLEKLNQVRTSMGLTEIKSAWHNQFIDEELLLDYTERKFDLVTIENFCSTYMLISRALHPKLVEPDEPTYGAKVNDIALMMPNMGDYGYLKLFVFRKKQ